MAGVGDALERLFSGKRQNQDGPVVENAASTPRPDSSHADLTALRKAVAKGRGRSKVDREIEEQKDAAKQAALDELFRNENWEEISTLYFDMRYAMTGFEYFRLDERQRRILAASMGPCMRILLQIDPAYIALIVFTANFGKIVAEKETMYYRVKQQAKAERIARQSKPTAVQVPRRENENG